MPTTTIDAATLRSLLKNGCLNLKKNKATVDELNVFPVPDGDTGKNMTATIEGGVLKTDAPYDSVSNFMNDFSKGALFSARGNSGVILSQYIRGIKKGMTGKSVLSVQDFINALASGVKEAYASVAKPVEGTMLTVIRESSAAVSTLGNKDLEEVLSRLIKAAKISLDRTPLQLHILQEAGVVDSGGYGIVCIYEGMLMALTGEEIEDEDYSLAPANVAAPFSAPPDDYDPEDLLIYGYCTEFILQLQKSKTDIPSFKIEDVKDYLDTIGDSIVAIMDGTIVKVHVHTKTPEKALAYARRFGELLTIKIENMSIQNRHIKYAIIAVANGSGIIDFFKKNGATYVIDGGQTCNPSTEDFLNAFSAQHADHIIVLPNNSNIIMTAEQAASMFNGSDIRVIRTRSIAEGYSALSMLDLSIDDIDGIVNEMTYYLPNVTTGYVTNATRDAHFHNVNIKKGDYIGQIGDEILSDADDKVDAALAMINALPDIDDKQVITAFTGIDVTDMDKRRFKEEVQSKYPLMEVGFIDGMQPLYSFIMAIE